MANPTTNYGFVLPTPTDLVTDLPADFDVALQGVDIQLKALQPGTTLGDLAYSSATANTNTRLAIGTTGQVLTVAGGELYFSSVNSSNLSKLHRISTSDTLSVISNTYNSVNDDPSQIFTLGSYVYFRSLIASTNFKLHQHRPGVTPENRRV